MTAQSIPESGKATGIVTRRELFLFFALFAILLAPAVLNGFPLVMGDSIAYSGQGLHWMRGKSAAVLVALPYRIAGYWALPIINCALNAAAWLLLCRVFAIRPNPFVVLLLALVSLQPLYTSAVLVDSWFFPAVILLVAAARIPPVPAGFLAGILLSCHGSGHIFAMVFALLAAVLRTSWRPVVAALVAAVVAFGLNLALDAVIFPDQPRLAKTFPAARAFSVQPELLAREAGRSGDPAIAEAAERLAGLAGTPATEGRRDLFWDIWKETEGRFNLADFERNHASAIIRDALVYRPLPLLKVIVQDFVSFYGPETELDFLPVLTETFPPAFETSRQADGLFRTPAVSRTVTALRYACYLAFLLALAFGWRRAPRSVRMAVLGAVATMIANDAFFAILSGPPDRYHHRVLPLLAAATLLLVSPRRGQPRAG